MIGQVLDVGGKYAGKVWMLQLCDESVAFCVCKQAIGERFYCTTCYFKDAGLKDCGHVRRVRDEYTLLTQPSFPQDEFYGESAHNYVTDVDNVFMKPFDEMQADYYEFALTGNVPKHGVTPEVMKYQEIPEIDQNANLGFLLTRMAEREARNIMIRFPTVVKKVVKQSLLNYRKYEEEHAKLLQDFKKEQEIEQKVLEKKEDEEDEKLSAVYAKLRLLEEEDRKLHFNEMEGIPAMDNVE